MCTLLLFPWVLLRVWSYLFCCFISLPFLRYNRIRLGLSAGMNQIPSIGVFNLNASFRSTPIHLCRPVTLVGYSLGAQVVFKCLKFLADTEQNAELVDRVVLLGAPISINDENWEVARKMVAGRFVNAYSTNDWMLGLAFRASLLTQELAGIQPIEVPGIENMMKEAQSKDNVTIRWDIGLNKK